MAPDRHGKDSDKIRKAPPFQKNFPNHGTVNVLLPLIYDCLEIGLRTSTCVFTSRNAPFNVADKKRRGSHESHDASQQFRVIRAIRACSIKIGPLLTSCPALSAWP